LREPGGACDSITRRPLRGWRSRVFEGIARAPDYVVNTGAQILYVFRWADWRRDADLLRRGEHPLATATSTFGSCSWGGVGGTLVGGSSATGFRASPRRAVLRLRVDSRRLDRVSRNPACFLRRRQFLAVMFVTLFLLFINIGP